MSAQRRFGDKLGLWGCGLDWDSIIHSALPSGFPRTNTSWRLLVFCCGGDNLFPRTWSNHRPKPLSHTSSESRGIWVMGFILSLEQGTGVLPAPSFVFQTPHLAVPVLTEPPAVTQSHPHLLVPQVPAHGIWVRNVTSQSSQGWSSPPGSGGPKPTSALLWTGPLLW